MPVASFNELMGLGSHAGNGATQSRVGLWFLNEASGNAIDVGTGGNDLTDNNTVGNATGLYGATHRDFESGSSEYLDHADDADLKPGNVDFGFLATLQLESKSADMVAVGKLTNNVNAYEYLLRYRQSTDVFQFGVSANGTVVVFASATNFGSPSTATKYKVRGWHDAANDVVGIAINGGTANTTAHTTGVFQGTGSFTVGREGQRNSDYWDGLQGNIVFLNGRIPNTTDESEYGAGPEPINSVAPAMTGTETQGQTLSCTTGTWAPPSPYTTNGTATYGYQWTRSNTAGGSGEADIGSATSSTYVLAAGDVGKYIRCRVRATNDGGYDAGADTVSNMSGAIASSSSTYTAAASLAAGPSTLAASATFSPGTHTAAATLSAGKATLAASATFSPGTHTAAATLTAGGASLAASATFSAGTHTAAAALDAGKSTLAASATFSPGTHSAAAALTAGPTSLTATATFAAGTKTAAASLSAGSTALAATATFSPGTKTAAATLSAGRATLAASATFSPGTHTAAVALAAGPTTLAAAVTFSAGTHTAAAVLAAGKSTLAASVSFALAQRTAAASLAAGPSTLVALATFTPSGLVRRYRNRHYRYVFAFGRRIR